MGTEYFDKRLPENNFHFLLWIRKHLWGHWTQSSVALELSQRMDHFNSFMNKKLGGKYVGPPERRGGRRREEAGEEPTAASSALPDHLTSTPVKSLIPTRNDNILKLANNKNENITN